LSFQFLPQYEEFGYTRYASLTKIVFFFFMVLVPILLLNMLIAMMGNTYQQVIDRSEKEWKRQVTKIPTPKPPFSKKNKSTNLLAKIV
jgi:inner membrane protein involved in colicin E2 resistance